AVIKIEPIGILKVDPECSRLLARLEPPIAVLAERHGARPGILANQRARAGSRAEPPLGERPPHVGPAHEPDARVEAVADDETIELHAVAVAGVIELAAI